MQHKIDELFSLWKNHEGAGGQVLVTYKGETIFEKCYGYANIELQVPMTQDSLFHVASVTKQFTAMCILILHERGLLNVNDDVRKYIPDLIRFPQSLTIKQMLNHASGLREYYDLFYLGGRSFEDHYAQHEARELIARQSALNFEPGTKFLYTNANYMLCATIVERLSGMTFARFCKENIFDPLGMDQSFIRDDPHMIVPNKVSSYHDNGYEYTNAILTFGLYGGTGLHTTCRQLHKFLRQYIDPTLISRDTMDSIMLDIPEINGKKGNYGCGVRINSVEGHRYIHHGGVNAGYRTVGRVYPQDDLIITAFTNTYNIPIETAAGDIARIVLGLPERVRKNLEPYKEDSPILENVNGVYFCDKNKDNFEICVADGTVYLDGTKLVHRSGSLYQQGRRNIWLCLGKQVMLQQDNSIMELRRLTARISPEYAQKCVGSYYCADAQGQFDIAYENGDLWIKHIRFAPQKLTWLEGDTFLYGSKFITFQHDETEKVTGYLYNSGHLVDIPFQKVL